MATCVSTMDRGTCLVFILLAIQAYVPCSGRKLPPGISPCSRNQSDFQVCALKNARTAIPYIIKGNSDYGIIPLDPLFVPEFRIDDSGKSQQIQIDLIMQNLTCHGLRNAQLTDFRVDFKKGEVMYQGIIPKFAMLGNYIGKGRVLILPINGHGAMNFTLENVDFTFSFRMVAAARRGGKEYMKPVDNTLEFNTTRCHIYMENIINGEKAINDQMNVFLNENWRDIVKDLGKPIGEVLNVATNEVLKAVFRNVPYDEIFPPS